ncbi:MAG: LptF/LptG family permease, partial [Rhodoferax sp.]
SDDKSAREYSPAHALTTLALLQTPTPLHLAELAWRLGLGFAALNFIVIGLASAGVNPRAGRVGNLLFAFLTFVVYFNLLVLGKSWIASGQVQMGVFLLALHGGALVMSLLWLTKRHHNWTLRLRRHRTTAPKVQA